MCSTARITHTLESIPFKQGREENEPENRRRLDIVINNPRLLIPDTRRTKILLDQTVTHPTAHSGNLLGQVGGNHMVSATKEARAANDSERLKHTKYDEDARQHNMEVCPMGFEEQGKWGQSTHKVFHLITTRMNKVNNSSLLPKSLSTSYWKQKIGLMLQSQVSKHVLYAIYDQPFRSNPSTPDTQDSYYHDLYPDSQASV